MATTFPKTARRDDSNGHMVVQEMLQYLRDVYDRSPFVPTPIVNGAWLKGSGGAAVWTALADADIGGAAPRIAALSGQAPGNDLNQAINNGWYQVINSPATANTPRALWGVCQVLNLDASNVRQVIYEYNNDAVWYRRMTSSAWTAWSGSLVSSIGSAPPAGPVDGMIWIWNVDTSKGVNWVFRYNAASGSAYKWEFIGGPVWGWADDSGVSNPGGWNYMGAALTLGRGGDYCLHGACRHSGSTGAVGTVTWYSTLLAGSNPFPGGGSYQYEQFTGGSSVTAPWRSLDAVGTVTAGNAVGLGANAGNWASTVDQRRFTVQPIRVA